MESDLKPILTVDQRWLLRSVGGWTMRDCMISPEGVSHLMQSMYGSSGHPIDGGPAWLASGFQCRGRKVVSKQPPVVTVTDVQINRYAAQLDAPLKAELVECQQADRAENDRVWKWCRCGREAECLRANEGDPFWGNRYHPSEAEVQEHYEECWRIRDWTDDLLDRALGFEIAGEQLGQLELFEVSA
jgi:hypothetical protein